jgi:CrcB protein
MILLYIALGGAVGAVARYGVGGWVQARTGFGFPWGTLAVNVLGALLIGFALRYLEAVRLSAEVRALVIIGMLGAFTTFSTFSYETVALLQDGEWLRAGAYAFGSLVLGLVAVVVGLSAASYVLQVRG